MDATKALELHKRYLTVYKPTHLVVTASGVLQASQLLLIPRANLLQRLGHLENAS